MAPRVIYRLVREDGSLTSWAPFRSLREAKKTRDRLAPYKLKVECRQLPRPMFFFIERRRVGSEDYERVPVGAFKDARAATIARDALSRGDYPCGCEGKCDEEVEEYHYTNDDGSFYLGDDDFDYVIRHSDSLPWEELDHVLV